MKSKFAGAVATNLREERLDAASFHEKPKTGVYPNPSGIQPVEYKVLILPNEAEKVTAGGIIVPDERHERNQMAESTGLLIAVGANAFEDWDEKPRPGQTVLFAKYAGLVAKGTDDKEYRICNDKDIAAVMS